ncbi:sensor histidine kinase [Muricoccus radiodurans]|uniref:sensor histidine kinase n=1 Tax=Muricoccus radiodurans TaxID=2231721 RepID=UPI003CFAFE14
MQSLPATPADEGDIGEDAPARTRPRSLGQRLAFVYGCISLAILVGAGLYAWWQASTLAGRNEAIATTETQRLAERIGSVLAQTSQGIAVLAATAPLDRDPAACQAALDAAFLSMSAFVRNLLFVDTQRRITCGTQREAVGTIASDSPLIRAAELTGRPVIGTLEPGPAGTGSLIGIGHPLRRDGRYAGSTTAVVTLADLREITRRFLPPIRDLRVWLQDSAGTNATLVGPESALPPLPDALLLSLSAPNPAGAGVAMVEGHLLVAARATEDLLLIAEVPESFVGAAAPLEVAIPPLLLAAVLLAGLAALFWAMQRFVFAPLESAMRRLESADAGGMPEALDEQAPAEIAGLVRRLGAARATRDEAIRLRDLLLREAHHRIKNHLSLVISFLRLQERHLSDHAALQALRAAQGRMLAIGLTYELLHDGGGQTVSLDQMLTKFARALASRDLQEGRSTQMDTDLEPIEVPADIAVKIALVVNELATNSLKYAFVGRAPGRVHMTLRRAGSGFTLRVGDDGAGLPDGARRGLGMTVVDSLLRAIGAGFERVSGPGTAFLITWQPRDGAAPGAEG